MGEIIKQINETGQEITPQQPKCEKGVIRHLAKAIREIIAALFWLYVLIKLFVFDIDIYLFGKFLPEYAWLLNLKFFILIGVLAALWLITKNTYMLAWSLYILFYPVVLFWKILIFVFKQRSWIFAFAFINTVISFFKSIKYNFIASAIYLVSIAFIFCSSSDKFLWFATASIFVLLFIAYIRSFILIFKSSDIYQIYIKIFSDVRKHRIFLPALDESIKNLPVENLDRKQLEKWTTNLQTSVLFNRICLFAAKKLRNYQNSSIDVVSDVLTILMLIILTIFSFAAINYGLYKIDKNLFSFSTIPTFFTFFYYSFNNLLFNSIQQIDSVMPISQAVSMIESFFALFLIVIFVSLLLSVRSKRHLLELNEVISGIEKEGEFVETFIREEYKINNIDNAMVELDKLKATLVKFIYKISESIK